jgi:hypothetical protein
MIPADEEVLRAHVRVSQVATYGPTRGAWATANSWTSWTASASRDHRGPLLDGLGEPVAGVIRAARRRRAPALPWLFVWRSPTARVVCRSTFDQSNGLERGGSVSRIGPDPRNLRNACAWVRAKMQQAAPSARVDRTLYMTRRRGACILERQRDGDLARVDGPAMPAAVEPTHRARPRPGHGSDGHARTPAPGLRAAGRASPARRDW